MKPVFAILCLVSSAALFPVALLAANDPSQTPEQTQTTTQTTTSQTTMATQDSPIVSKIRSEMAAEHVSSMTGISVDADTSGVVSLSGSALSQDDVDKVVSIAHNTEGVTAVNNNVTVKATQ
jgi:osmotically-inducible protein OsmY